MGKKDKKRGNPPDSSPVAVVNPSLLSVCGRKYLFSGIGLVVLGFIVLSFTDSMGQNMASRVSPFLLIGGYALIGVGFIAKDPA